MKICQMAHDIVCRGSLGFGEDALQSLPGNIGTHDVADCIAALDEAIAQGTVLQPSMTQRTFLSTTAAILLPKAFPALKSTPCQCNTSKLTQSPLTKAVYRCWGIDCLPRWIGPPFDSYHRRSSSSQIFECTVVYSFTLRLTLPLVRCSLTNPTSGMSANKHLEAR